ncbi:putative DNA-binding transcriptional regulator YafY [Nakamurella sp. UYEF19]|uniref:helix-turn-helix transcriptional regulator n=1 Tax=Nakamurella sp. UYEF19 TaxID=1756392 RepID=UPI00339A8361
MLETSTRLLRLLSLLQTHREWSGTDLADRLGVTERTIRRDVEKVRALGYVVKAQPGSGQGYRLAAGGSLPPLLLEGDEAVAIAVGLRGVTLSGVTGMEETAVQALIKLEQVMPDRLKRRIDTLRGAIVPMADQGPSVDVDVLVAVAAAVRDRETLRADYRDFRGARSTRRLQPQGIVHSQRLWYLVAWDVDRADWRTFRMDRLEPRIPSGPRFPPREPPASDLSQYVSRGISIAPYRYRCRITIHAPAQVVAERIGPSIGVITAIDDQTCELVAGSESLDQMALYIGLLGHEMAVHEPPELAAHLARTADRFNRAAGGR